MNVTTIWSHERVSRLILALTILAGTMLGYFVSPWAYLILVGTALNLLQFSFTGKCVVKDCLDRLEVPYDQPPAHLVRPVSAGMPNSSEHVSSSFVGIDFRLSDGVPVKTSLEEGGQP